MTLIKSFLKKHTLFTIYTIVFLIILNGVIATSGSKHLPKMLLFYSSLVIFYFGLQSIFKKKKLDFNTISNWISNKVPHNLDVFLGLLSIAFIVIHLIRLGGSPAIKSFSEFESAEIVKIRNSIVSDVSSIWNYIASFNIKALLPFSLLLFHFKKKHLLFYILFFIGIFYAFSLMQKSYILTVLLPILLYTIFTKKHLKTFILISICSTVIIGLVFVTNPQMRGGIDNVEKIKIDAVPETIVEDNTSPYIVRVFTGLNRRMFVVPGEMVSCWFDIIPEEKPFLNGNGYTFVTKFTGKEYHDYAKELYPVIRPQYAKKGLKGSVNVASFVYEYSNFGKIGIVLSAFFLALLFAIMELIFINNFRIKVSLNLFPIFMLSSGALTTAMFSGGWGLIIFLYFIFSKDFNISNE